MTVAFFVRGEPEPQGNHTAFKRGKRIVIVEGRNTSARERFANWRGAVVTAAALERARLGFTLDGPLVLECRFLMPRPKSISVKARPYPVVPPDADKLTRAVGDALKLGELVADDALFVDLVVSKRYAAKVGDVGVHVMVSPLLEKEDPQWQPDPDRNHRPPISRPQRHRPG